MTLLTPAQTAVQWKKEARMKLNYSMAKLHIQGIFVGQNHLGSLSNVTLNHNKNNLLESCSICNQENRGEENIIC